MSLLMSKERRVYRILHIILHLSMKASVTELLTRQKPRNSTYIFVVIEVWVIIQFCGERDHLNCYYSVASKELSIAVVIVSVLGFVHSKFPS